MKTLRKLSKSKFLSNSDNVSSQNNLSSTIHRRKSSSKIIAMHRGSFGVLLVGNENLGMKEICQIFAKKCVKQSVVVASDERCNDLESEMKYKASVIFPSPSNNSECFHYEINISVVTVEWRRKNLRLYKDFITSTDALVFVYNETKRQSFVSVIELVSEMKHCCRQQNPPPVNIACVKAQKGETKDLRKDDLNILNEDVFDIDLNCVDSINKMFHSLLCKYVD